MKKALNKYIGNYGFSIVELLTVLFIIGMLSTIVMINFGSSSKGAAARHQTVSAIVGDLRRAQTMALSGSTYDGESVCGFGIHFVDQSSYILFAGIAPTGQCLSTNRVYEITDAVVETSKLINNKMLIDGGFSDIFFESPGPITYIGENPDSFTEIAIRENGVASCDVKSNCTVITIGSFGRIDID